MTPRRHPEFEPPHDDYPGHLREAVAGLPSVPGVYIFHGQEGDLPLYIGKSVNVRSRVLSHLRNPEESHLLRQTRLITHIPTAGELGALLLEAQLIKQQQPLLNQKLRRQRQLCAFQVLPDEDVPRLVYSTDVDFATEPSLFGLFSSRVAALEALHQLADQHRLCCSALGLEKLKAGRACFRAMVRLCAGVCHGQEGRQAHASRLLSGIEGWRVITWPYPGAIGLTERHGDHVQIHVIRNWCYLGSAGQHHKVSEIALQTAKFDADGYRILRRPLMSGQADITLL